MTQNIQFQQVVLYGMIIKMGGYHAAFRLVGRVLDRREGINIFSLRQHHNAPGMLARGLSGSLQAHGNALDLAAALRHVPLFKIFISIGLGGLLRYAQHSSRFKGITLAEEHLRIFMGLVLELSGEVQIDIRFLVPLKAQEGFKGNVKAIGNHGRSAMRAVHRRHIRPGPPGVFPGFFVVENAVFALRAAVMGRQGIHFGNAAGR